MRIQRAIKIAALNVAMHKPHSPAGYFQAMRLAWRSKYMVKLGSLHGVILGFLTGPKEYIKGSFFTGEIFRFVNLDPDQPWYNLETGSKASDAEVNQIKIPDHLLPHLQRIDFAFFPENHKLWLVTQDRTDRLGSKSAELFFQTLFDHVSKKYHLPKIEVTIIPDRDTVANMFAIHRLEKVFIELKRPNADDGHMEEQWFLKKLENQQASRQLTELVAEKGASIKPDAETTALANVASKNGSVKVIGRAEDGTRVQESTLDRPMILSRYVNSENETAQDVLIRTAREN